MAKGLRASVKKGNKAKLRARVFGPVEDARTARLSAKLLELASQPKPPSIEMDVEQEDAKSTERKNAEQMADVEAMDVVSSTKSKTSSSPTTARSGRIQKRRHRKASNSIIFTKFRTRRKDESAKKNKR